MITGRREFLIAGAALGVSGIAAAAEQAVPGEDVSAIEDLMREHGVLRRILLVYEECLRRLDAKKEPPPDAVFQSAKLVREFVEDYHEKLEEDFLFPEFEKRNELVPLVKVLREQHAAGRVLTREIIDSTSPIIMGTEYHQQWTPEERRNLMAKIEAFLRMYGPHAAREDTVLFPALHKLLSAKQLDELGDKFEAEENRRFGAGGFEKIVEQVATIEKSLGIYDLGQFTPQAK